MGATGFDKGFLRGARVGLTLLTSTAVADRWGEASVLPQMSVGMLACHLGKQLVHARDLATAPDGDGGGDLLLDAAEHYRRAAWVTTPDLDHPVNDRSRSEDEARAGHDALCSRIRQAVEDLEALVGSGSLRDVVTIPLAGLAPAPRGLPTHADGRGRGARRRPGAQRRHPDADLPQ